MPFIKKGMTHSLETRQKMSESWKGVPKSEEQKRRISESTKGLVREKKHNKKCPCGASFQTGSAHAVYCSVKCKRAAKGHGLLHAPEFKGYPKSCAICGSTCSLVGDHDHRTGLPRGVLCRNCNLAIGNMFDDPRLLREAANYLEGAKTSTYLSGPMSGLPDLNKNAFDAEATRLRAEGITVVSPAEIKLHDGAEWADYMRADLLAMLERCNRIHLLPGWRRSRDARVEFRLARALKFQVTFSEGA